MIIEAAYHLNKNKHAKHSELNYKICNAMDPIKFDIVLKQMVDQGMDPEMVAIFDAQFQGLLAAIRAENNRLTTWMK